MAIITVEDIFDNISGQIENEGISPKSFELEIPSDLTLRGNPVPNDVAMAIIVDAILAKGYWPDGYTESATGRVYKYVRSD